MLEKICLIFIGAAIISRLVLVLLYDKFNKSLRREGKEKEGDVFKKIVKKFTYYGELKKPIRNTYAFVEAGIKEELDNNKAISFFDILGRLLILVAAGIVFCGEISVHMDSAAGISEIVGILIFSISDRFADKEKIIKGEAIKLIDYLDNTVALRYRKKAVREDYNGKKIYEADKEADREEEKQEISQNSIKAAMNGELDKAEAEKVINQVLQEYLA